MAIHPPIRYLKTRSGLEPVPRCPLADDITTAPLLSVFISKRTLGRVASVRRLRKGGLL